MVNLSSDALPCVIRSLSCGVSAKVTNRDCWERDIFMGITVLRIALLHEFSPSDDGKLLSA